MPPDKTVKVKKEKAELALGKKAYQIGKQAEICNLANKRMSILQKEAEELHKTIDALS